MTGSEGPKAEILDQERELLREAGKQSATA